MGLLPSVSKVPTHAVAVGVRTGRFVHLGRRKCRDVRGCLGLSPSEEWVAARALREVWLVAAADDHQLYSGFLGASAAGAGGGGKSERGFGVRDFDFPTNAA